MKYFIPNWEDRLDRNFDFVNDCNSPKRKSPKRDVYAHNIYKKKTPYDGIIMSLNIFGSKITVNGDVEISGEKKTIKEYLKVRHKQKNLKVICDCGAFSYINDKEPPALYTPRYISKIYDTLKFDYGVSVDHLIAKNLSKYLKEKRRLLSLDNAIRFYSHWKRKEYEYSFKPIGAAQGDTVNDYEKSVKTLISVGYKYIGLGTLIPRTDEFILQILEKISPLIKKSKIKLHLFGILRKDCINDFIKHGVTSFDSASYLRKAWLRSDNNYLGSDLNWYSAIRVPIVDEVKLKEEGHSELSILKHKLQEKDILKQLNSYDKGNERILDEMLENINDYDKSLIRTSESTKDYADKYRKVLEEKIWKRCDCAMCKQAGIHIAVFRRTNRNKRRGFHNTYIFYHNYLNS